jgi:dienelactone hydrolase
MACGDDAAATSGSGGPIVARFHVSSATPAVLDVPFPSDAYLEGGHFVELSGVERLFPQSADFFAKQLARIDGWSRIAPAMFAIDDLTAPANADSGEAAGAAVDRASLPASEDDCKADGSSVFLVDLESGERIACRAVVDDEREGPSGRTVVGVGPARGVVLQEGHRYAAILTSRVKDAGGHPLAASADFDAAIKKQGALGALYGAAYDKVQASLGAALGADRIVAIAPYTTQAITRELYAMRDALEAAPAPALAWDAATVAPMGAVKFAATVNGQLPAGFTASLDDWLGVVAADKKLPDGQDDPDEALPVRAHDKIAAFGTAAFEATNYLQVRPGGYDDLEHGTFARDGAGNPIPAPEAPTAKIWLSIATPTAPMPASGYPVVIVQHGLSSSRQYLLSLANRFCDKGWIAVAIDSVTFGARASDPKFRVDQTTDYAATATYKGPDGISDLVQGERAGSFDFFGSLKNIRALGDQLRQAALDTAQVVKVLRSSPDLTPLAWNGATPKIDPDRIAYIGDSLGGIEGAAAAAIEPHVKAWTLNVAGGGVLVEIGAHGPGINAQLAIAGSVNFGLHGVLFAEAHPLVAMGQTLLEAGDPIAYAKHLVTEPAPLAGQPTAPRNVLQTEVVYDELVANEGGEALARAAGYGLASPNVGLNAGITDLAGKRPYPGGTLVLPSLTPDGAGFHDTPVPGITALVAQISPAQHGADLVRSDGNREYAIPFNTPEGALDVKRGAPVAVPCPYRPLQASIVGFFADAFDGKVPVVTGLPTPVRDLDGDGRPDETDPAPLDPSR